MVSKAENHGDTEEIRGFQRWGGKENEIIARGSFLRVIELFYIITTRWLHWSIQIKICWTIHQNVYLTTCQNKNSNLKLCRTIWQRRKWVNYLFNVKDTLVQYHTFGAFRVVCVIRNLIKINFHTVKVIPRLPDDLQSCWDPANAWAPPRSFSWSSGKFAQPLS